MSEPGGDPSSGISSGDALILPERHPACRRREARPGFRMERENLCFVTSEDVKGQAASGSNREGESTEAERRGGGAKGLRCSALAIGQPETGGARWRGKAVQATAEHRQPCDLRGSRTVLGAPGGEIPPGDSTTSEKTGAVATRSVNPKQRKCLRAG